MGKKKTGTDDYGYKKTDEQLENLEARLSSLYTDASKNMQEKLGDFLTQYKDAEAEKQAELKAGTITEKEYKQWAQEQILTTKKMQAQVDALTEDLVNTDKLARQMINGELPSSYATNYNFEGYKAEMQAQASGIDYSSFTIYNADAVSRIVSKNPDLLPAVEPKHVDTKADTKWNKDHINLAIAQGILQGDPVDKIAERLQQVTTMDENAAIRNARTALIGAQNAGRKDAADRVREAGIEMIDVWSCTYDDRTRDTHIALDGQERGKDGYFHTFTGEKLEYPCDPNGAPAEVYNCRCRLNSFIKGIDHSKDKELYEDFMEKGGYEGWEKTKEKAEEKREGFEKNKVRVDDLLKKEDLTSGKSGVVQGKDIIDTWTRREDKFQFEIDDAMDAQGFNGLPRVVSTEEFDKAVKESNFIAQRVYSAKDKATLDSYRDQLYNGDWYVNCSVGGAHFGQGMYTIGNSDGIISDYMKESIANYEKKNANKRGEFVSYVETLTMTPDAKIIDIDELADLRERGQNMDIGVFGVLKGYDAIQVDEGEGNSYTVILNRTKCIFKEDTT